ncbi:hypothetical protein vseg_021430 [Gypsophila vaccaria]
MNSPVLTCLVVVLLLLVLVSNEAAATRLVRPVDSRDNPSLFPAVFNFGDSNSDTGTMSAAFGRAPYPNGMTFFGHPSGRSCDGRLIIDFIAEKLNLPHLSAYLDAIESNFRHGANFAACGTTIVPVAGMLYGHGATPIPLNLQVLQFQQFKERVLELYKQGTTSDLENRLPKPEDFSKALYTMDMGQNDIDLIITMEEGDQANESLPAIVDAFGLAIEQLHQLGGRKFMIHNTGPYGCLPTFVEKYPYKNSPKKHDLIGCVKSYNQLAQTFNQLLKDKVSLLQTKLPHSSLVYVDIYSAKYSLIRDATQHGFDDRLGYCCKDCANAVNPYWIRTVENEQSNVSKKACHDPTKYISWDGAHYTEAANHLIADHIFDGSSYDPLVNLLLFDHVRSA